MKIGMSSDLKRLKGKICFDLSVAWTSIISLST